MSSQTRPVTSKSTCVYSALSPDERTMYGVPSSSILVMIDWTSGTKSWTPLCMNAFQTVMLRLIFLKYVSQSSVVYEPSRIIRASTQCSSKSQTPCESAVAT